MIELGLSLIMVEYVHASQGNDHIVPVHKLSRNVKIRVNASAVSL